MIRVTRPALKTLSRPTRKEMSDAHATAKTYPRGSGDIKRAWKNFRARNAGKEVCQQLATASRGKCYFCERINAKTLDHYYPKERYPKRMFRWKNLLLCCWDCNHSKGERFPFKDRYPLLLDPTND